MDPLVTHLQPFFQQPFFQWLLATSWQAGVLVCLILLAQKVLGRWIGVRGRHWLWLVLLIRMVMFSAPPSAVSVYNLLPPPRLAGCGLAATLQPGNVGSALATTEGPSVMGGHTGADPAADRYLTWDKEGNVAASGGEPNDPTRWCVLAHTSGAGKSPYPFAHSYLRPVEQG